MTETIWPVIVFFLFAANAAQYIAHFKERRDLYDRLMCRDVNEYKALGYKKRPPPLTAHKKAIENWRGACAGQTPGDVGSKARRGADK